ncbi:hypothetical protein CQW23_32724 [Capsicum baccatum]|uniref:Calmodulin-binding domain-containing protein n=1 Tax=Capsicum baccatum TaxID=33114 RepID=A0A2G2V3W8_CAPBA|nr:hypothetical protein CQW23_32724 [Capsicum baccatum]
MPETEKKMKSSSKILRGVDAGGKKDSVGNYRKQIIAPKVSTEKSLKTPTLSSPPKSSSVKPFILRVRSHKSLKLLAPLKDQNKMRRDGTNKLNPKMIPEKTLRTPKVKASPKSSSHLQSRLLSNKEDKKEVVKPADSALGKYTSSSKKLLHIAEAETVGKNQKKTLRKGKTSVSNDNNSSTVKLKFRRGVIVDLHQETSSPRRLTFRWGRHIGESQDSNTRNRIFIKKGVDGDKSNTIRISGKIVLRHQDVQEKKDVQGLLNNVIEEMTSKLVETGKSKCQGSRMMAEDNYDELASLVTSVKNDTMAEDNIDELVNPVTSVKNNSMAEDNIDELVSPVTSEKNESAGSKPDKISIIKPRSMSIRNKVLPCYRSSSSTSSYNAGNTKRQSTGKLNAPDSGQDVIPHYLRASTSSCNDFCKYGRKHFSEAKSWHPLSKRKNKLSADEQSLARTLV